MTLRKRLPQGEFVALLAFLFAMVALSIDAMLPALPAIGQAFSPGDPNRAQLVLTSFVFGMGIGTLFAGPLSDSFGRKIVIQLGLLLYGAGALLCYVAPSLEVLLLARILQGLGVAAPRIVSLAIARDLYSGREMARIISFAQMIFTTIPAMAPFMGVGIIWLAGWKSIFLVYVIIAAVCALWFGLRQPETLLAPARQPLVFKALGRATIEMFKSPSTTVSILVQSLILGMLFSTLSSIQGIFEQQFDRASSFPLWFAIIALVSMSGSFVNARVVMTHGMRKMVLYTFVGQFGISVLMLVLFGFGLLQPDAAFAAFILWTIGLFAMMGMTMGNLNALALEPLGHIAGLVSSVMSCIATVVSVILAIPVGLMFDGTNLPLILGGTVFSGLALILVRFGLTEA
jgi:DHA1 family bicyclomycin/chloramphenicol resistance-like MFS transporter